MSSWREVDRNAPFPKKSRETARYFRRRYIIALSLIAGLAIAGQVLVQRALNDQQNGSHVINEAGSQRMLSQRLALKMMIYDGTRPDGPEQLHLIAALRDRWLEAHTKLVAHIDEFAFGPVAKTSLAGLLDNLDQPQQRLAAMVDRLLAQGRLTEAERNEVLTNQEIFLPLMDAVVSGFEQSARERVAFLQNVELSLLGLTLAVLLVEALLIFRPAVNRLEGSLEKLEQWGQQAAKRLESLRHLAGGIAHNFNNILTGIQGHAELQRIEAQGLRQGTEYIDAQIEGCRRAADIVSQLLKYSGYGRFDFAPTDLAAWLGPVVQSVTPADSPVEVRFKVIEDSRAKVDREAITHVVHGLVANALEAMVSRSGGVVVQLSQMSMLEPRMMSGPYRTVLAPGLYACVRVIDEGEGITAEELEHIFDPYHTRKDFGRGLGLAAILGVAHSHGGGVELESRPGCGAVATLYLPNIEAGVGRTAEAARAEKPGVG